MIRQLLLINKKKLLLPLAVAVLMGTSTPAQAYGTDHYAMLRKVIAFFAPLFNLKQLERLFSGRPKQPRTAQKNVNLRVPAAVVLRHLSETNAGQARPEQPRSAPAQVAQPIAQPDVPVASVAVPQANASLPVVASEQSETRSREQLEETLDAHLDALYTCIQRAGECKQDFLDGNITRSYKEFKKRFDANLAALQVLSTAIAQKSHTNEQFKTLSEILATLIRAQSEMCQALNGEYSSGIGLGMSLSKIEQPTAKARADIVRLIARMKHAVRGKHHTLHKVTTVANDIHVLLAPPAEQGLGVINLLSICSKRV